MRLLSITLALCIAHTAYCQNIFNSIASAPGNTAHEASNLLSGIFGSKTTDPCDRDVFQDYRKAVDDFHNKLYTHIAARSDNHFVFSPYTIWLSLSALAEGSDPSVQSQVLTSLNLPQEKCLRQKFYNIALNIEQPGHDVTLRRTRSLILDEDIKVYPAWADFVHSTKVLNFAFAPIKRDPKETSIRLRKFIQTRSNIAVKGNSVILDALDYQGLWTTAFAEADVRSQPFFNELGEQIGTVDMMHMKKKVRLAHVPFMSAKVLELPVGTDGRYTMLIAVGTGNNILKNAIEIFMGSILEIFSLLQMSLFPLDVAVPRFAISSESDLKPALEDAGIRAFWRDPAATRYVSNPPATPGGYIQRVSVVVDRHGVNPPPAANKGLLSSLVNLASDTATGAASAVGHDFTADRPFMFALFDTKTHTCLFAGAYARPNTETRQNI